jgi:hypothetical protein
MASLKKCIEAMCKSCIYDPADVGSWRHQVEKCTSGPTAKVPCPLWEVRPITMETMLARRKEKSAAGVDLDALVEGLEDEDETPEAVAA